jgi:glycosyltransferase involved in cell wall biosynthesis
MTRRIETDLDRVTVVTTSGRGSLASYARHLAAATAAPTIEVDGCSGTFGHRFVSGYALRRLRREVGAVRELASADAPLLHFTSHHLARYGPWTGKPYVVTVHDLMRHRDWRDRGRETPLIHRPNLRDRLYLRLDAAGLRRADALVAVSQHTRRELVDVLGISPARVVVIPEGVDCHAFRPVPERLLGDPYILYVGSEQPRKNLDTLFRAFVRARANVPNLKLVKVGAPGGSEAPFRRHTLERARATGALPDLVIVGEVTHDELLAWYSGAHCLVLPSRHEGFGLPPLEAMACGCPAVVSSAGALPEVVGDAGVVYGLPDDVGALAEALRRVVSRPETRARLSLGGLRRAREMTWEATAGLTRRLWRELLADRARTGVATARRAATIGEAPLSGAHVTDSVAFERRDSARPLARLRTFRT